MGTLDLTAEGGKGMVTMLEKRIPREAAQAEAMAQGNGCAFESPGIVTG